MSEQTMSEHPAPQPPLSPLVELMEMSWEIAANWLQTKTEQILPQFNAETASGKRIMVIAPWANEEEKGAALGEIRRLFAEQQVVRYVLICEAWGVRRAVAPTAFDPPPSQSPDRHSIVMVLGVDPEAGEVISYCAETIGEEDAREGESRLTGKREVSIANRNGGPGGLMAGLLGPIQYRTLN